MIPTLDNAIIPSNERMLTPFSLPIEKINTWITETRLKAAAKAHSLSKLVFSIEIIKDIQPIHSTRKTIRSTSIGTERIICNPF
jgi:hypothetical protein